MSNKFKNIILMIICIGISGAAHLSYAEDPPHYRGDIPEVTRFVNVPESAAAKLDFPVQMLTAEEQAQLKEKHTKSTQFMVIGTADGRVGNVVTRGNDHNFREGNKLNIDGNEYTNIYQDGRAVLFVKGLIKGEYLLTGRYDSTKDNQDHLYKYINPERYYPVYGDDSSLTNDADSQGQLFVKVERDSSFALMGNYSTEEFEATQVARYNRGLEGMKVHLNTEDFGSNDTPSAKLHLTSFLANTTQEEKEDTFSANGVSGPFYLSKTPVLEYTERIRVETRDNDKSDTILNTRYLVRDQDYQIEYDNGRIFLKKAIGSRDENNDPVYIVVRYEYSANTDRHYDIMGNRAEARLFPGEDNTYKLMIAGQRISEQRELYNWYMNSADAIFYLTPEIRLAGEYAYSDKSEEEYGYAQRVEATTRFFDDRVILQGYASEINQDFFNPVNVAESGVQKYGGLAQIHLTDNVSLIGDNWASRSMTAHTYDRKTSFDVIGSYDKFFLSAGYRLIEFTDQDNIIRDTKAHGAASSQGVVLSDNVVLSNTMTYSRENKYDIPSDAQAEDQRDTYKMSPRLDIKMGEDVAFYARHDLVTNDKSYPYDSNTTTVGVSKISPEGIRSYVEYGFTGDGTATTSIGQEANMPLTDRMSLRSYTNTKIDPYHTSENMGYDSRIRLLDNLYTDVSFERNVITGSQGHFDYDAESVSLEYIEGNNTLGGKAEHRDENKVTRKSLFTNGSLRLFESTTLLGKTEYTRSRDHAAPETTEDYKKAIFGIAHRPAFSNYLNFFGKYEYEENMNKDATISLDTHSHTGSVEGIYEPLRWLEISGKYAIKEYIEDQDDLYTQSVTDMFTVRPSLKVFQNIDVTGIYRRLKNYDINTTKHFISLETGITLFDQLRVAVGYNLTEYNDLSLPDEDYKGYGIYLNGSLALWEYEIGKVPGMRYLTMDKTDLAKEKMLRERIKDLSQGRRDILNQKYREAEALYKEGKYNGIFFRN